MSAPTSLPPLPWHVSPGPASGAAVLSSSHFPNLEFPGGGGGEVQQHWLMGSPPYFGDCHSPPPYPPTVSLLHCPHLGHLQAAGQSHLAPGGAADRLLPTCWCWAIVIPDHQDPVWLWHPPKGDERLQTRKAKISGSFDRKRILIFFPFVDVLILINHLFPPSCSSSSSSSFCSSSLKRARTGNYTRSSTELGANPPPPPPYPAHT